MGLSQCHVSVVEDTEVKPPRTISEDLLEYQIFLIYQNFYIQEILILIIT